MGLIELEENIAVRQSRKKESKISKRCGTTVQGKWPPHKEILDLSQISTLFFQTLSPIPGQIFQKLKRRHNTGRCTQRVGFGAVHGHGFYSACSWWIFIDAALAPDCGTLASIHSA